MATAPDPHYVSEFSRRITQSRREGLAEGVAKGKAKGKAEAILAVLQSRGVRVTKPERAQVLGCNDDGTLDTWIAAAPTAGSVRELLAQRPGRRAATTSRVRRRTVRPAHTARRRKP